VSDHINFEIRIQQTNAHEKRDDSTLSTCYTQFYAANKAKLQIFEQCNIRQFNFTEH